MSAPRVGDVIAGRYRVLSELGAGATCRVLRVRDESGPRGEDDPAASSRAGDVVALKLFAPQTVEGTLEGRVRFRREARVLSALSHASIVRILGLGEHELAPYLTMELVEGGTLESMLAARAKAGDPLSDAEVLRISIELARGLAFAHSRGITHRDLKPANVLLRVNEDGETLTTIADFGVAQLGEAREGEKGWVIGTPGYMAPEQCHVVDGGVDERSDLFALGVVAYELATGERPFRAETLAVYIRELATRSPAPPSRRRESLSAMLESVILRLLSRAPNARYQTAQGALHDLERIARQPRAVVFELGTRDLRGTVGARTSLVGRGEASQCLSDAWERAASGAGEVIVLEAPSGIGKTRLVEELAPLVAARRGVLLRGKNYEFEAPAPFRTLTEAVRDLLTQDEGTGTPSTGVERLRLALRDLDDVILRVVPELEQLLGAPRTHASAPHDQELLRVREAYVRLFQALSSESHPLAIFLDDLQWSDEDALEVVRQLARELTGHPILLVLACRERDLPTSARRADKAGGLAGLLGSLEGRATFVKLAPLGHDDIAALVSGMLDGAPEGVVRLVAKHVAIGAAGNPLFVEEQVRGLVADGIVSFAADVGWRCDEQRLAATDPPNNVVEVIIARASRLRAEVKSVVETAAIVGRQVPFEVLRELCPELSVEALVDSLDEAVRAYLLTRTPAGDYAFTCDRALQALYEGMTPEARVKLHVALCHRLETQRARGRVVSAADLARHSRAMGDETRALRYGVEAARDAWAMHAYLVASRFYEDALSLATGALRDEIRLELAETLVVIGRYAEAVTTVTRTLGTTEGEASRARLLRVMAAAHFALGRYDEATVALETALAAEGLPVARSRVATGLSLGRTLLGLASDAVKRAARRGALEPAPASSARTSSFTSDEVGVIDTLGRLYFFTDMWKFVDVSLFGYRRLRDATDPGARLYAYASHAVFCQILGLPGRARGFADRARALEVDASLLQLARGLPVIALYDQLCHDLDRGLPAARRAEEACVRAGDLWSLCVALDMQVSMLLARSDLVAAGRSADRFHALVEQHDVRQRRARALLLSSYMAFLLGRVDGPSCESELARARVDSEQMGDELTAAAIAWMHADVALATGDVARALPLAEDGVALVRKQRRLHPDALLAVATLTRVLVRHHAGGPLTRATKRRLRSLADDAVGWGQRFAGLLGPGLGAKALVETLIEPQSRAAREAWDRAVSRMTDTDDLVRLAQLRVDRAFAAGQTRSGPSFDDAREALLLLETLGARGAARYGRIVLSLEPIGLAMTTRPSSLTHGQQPSRAVSVVTQRVPSSEVLSTSEVAKLFEADEEEGEAVGTLRSAASDREAGLRDACVGGRLAQRSSVASFRSKLDRLGAPPTTPKVEPAPIPASAPADLTSLRDRIATILGRDRARSQPHEPSASELPFARHDTPSGPLYRRILRYSPAHRVGRFSVIEARTARSEMLALLALDPTIAPLDPAGFLYVDTETTGLAGGTGTVAFLLGMARFEGDGSLVLEQLLLRQLGEEAPILERFLVEAARATCLVSFNGKSFDLPLLRSRLVMNRMAAPAEPPHLDLVHVARRVHRDRLRGCSLISVEEHVLGFVREDDVPSGDVVARYRHFLRSGDDSALLGVVDHNAWDIVALAALVGLYGAPMQTLGAEDLVGIARTLRRAGALGEAIEAADRAVDGGAGAVALRERAEVSRARGERDRAVADLERLLDGLDDPAARLSLAKLYEHHVRTPAAALHLVAKGTTETEPAAARRRARLEKKIARDTQTRIPGIEPRRGKKAKKSP